MLSAGVKPRIHGIVALKGRQRVLFVSGVFLTLFGYPRFASLTRPCHVTGVIHSLNIKLVIVLIKDTYLVTFLFQTVGKKTHMQYCNKCNTFLFTVT